METTQVQYIVIICFIVVAFIAIIGSALLMNTAWKELDDTKQTIGTVLGFISMIAILIALTQYNDIQMYEDAEKMIANGADVYLDGQKIDVDKIILRDYNVTIKEDYVILSKKLTGSFY